jgi:hypothetical protein
LSAVDNLPTQVKPEPPKVFAQVNAFANPINAIAVDVDADAEASSDDENDCHCKK